MSFRISVVCAVVLVGIGTMCLASAVGAEEGHSGERIPVMVELEDEPTAVVFSKALGGAPHGASAKSLKAATDAAKTQLALIEAAQQGLVSRLEAELGATVLSRTQRVYNGVAVLIDRDDLARLVEMPGVRTAYPLPPPILHNAVSVPFIGGVEAWTHDPTATGAGVTIGIIDTGVDYIHCDLGGSGSDADYDLNDPTTVDDGLFPTSKVVGGWDFAGGTCDEGAPVADADPFFDSGENGGHGTHVAGTAAGSGSDDEGLEYTGVYNESTPFDDMTIGPGIAPEASLVALKVIGRCATAATITQAIEWAADPDGDGDFSDHLDVINLSVGCSAYGSTFEASCEKAADNAVLAGVAVAVAAGNNGDGLYNTGSPESAVRVLSVGATGARPRTSQSATVWDSLGGRKVPVAYQFFGTLESVDAEIVLADPRHACSPLDNAAEVEGRIVVVNWRKCGLDVKAAAAEIAGAVGVIVYPEGWPGPPLAMPGGRQVSMPVAMVNEADGEILRLSQPGLRVSMGFDFAEFDVADVIMEFSSRGPRAFDSMLKPDIAAPGYGVFSAKAGTGDTGIGGWGTSMAAPHGAGALAVVRGLHPDWTVEELKALLMNTAAPVSAGIGADAPPAPMSQVGAGRIDLGAAIRGQVVAFAAAPEGAVSLSFGLAEVMESESWTRTVKVVNKGNEAMDFSVSISSASGYVRGMAYRYHGAQTVTIPPGGELDLDVELDAWSMGYLEKACDPGAARTVPVKSFVPGIPLPDGPMPMARQCVSEHTGFLVLEPTASNEHHPILRVPLYAVIRRVSDMRAAADRVLVNTERGSFDLPLTGVGLEHGAFSNGGISLVSAFELVEKSPDDAETDPARNFWDLAHVGVTSSFRRGGIVDPLLSDTIVSFAVATHAPWAHPNQVEVNVRIDRDRDGHFEYTAENLSLVRWDSVPGYDLANHPRWADVPWVLLARDNEATWQMPVNWHGADVVDAHLLNSDVMVLPVFARDLDMTREDSVFDFKVELVDRALDRVVDSTSVHTFDVVRPGLALSQGALYWPDWDDFSIPVSYDREAYLANGSEGLLLIHHHNASGERAEVIEITPGPADDGGAPEPTEVE